MRESTLQSTKNSALYSIIKRKENVWVEIDSPTSTKEYARKNAFKNIEHDPMSFYWVILYIQSGFNQNFNDFMSTSKCHVTLMSSSAWHTGRMFILSEHKNDHFIRGTRNVNCNMYNSNVTTLHYHCHTTQIYQLYSILNLFFYV